ncbi:hypothetical protein LXA43DRAFT_142563 [Ganoderma leucocontextum]|nr:hypothetical protein LXA43DRAFT_142563 [Ganoderma leucocontextum]
MAQARMLYPLFVLFVVGLLSAFAQNTTAVCRKEFDWMTNSRGQNPCLVTAWLWTPCYGTGNATFVSPVPTNWVYEGPTAKDPFDSTPCDCNTVLYSTMAACGICQGAGIEPWPTYKVNCTNVYNGTYPESIPGGTAIPAWAFLDVTRNSTFDVEAAKALAEQNLPDLTDITSSSASASASSSGSTPPSPPSAASSTVTSTTSSLMNATSGASTTSSSAHGSNDAPLVGGIVSGILGLLLIGTLALFIVLRHRKRARRARPNAHEQRAPAVSEFWDGPGLTMKGPNAGLLYDIADPRTYPARMDTQGVSSVSSDSSGGHGHSVPFPLGRGVANAGYRGYPQI